MLGVVFKSLLCVCPTKPHGRTCELLDMRWGSKWVGWWLYSDVHHFVPCSPLQVLIQVVCNPTSALRPLDHEAIPIIPPTQSSGRLRPLHLNLPSPCVWWWRFCLLLQLIFLRSLSGHSFDICVCYTEQFLVEYTYAAVSLQGVLVASNGWPFIGTALRNKFFRMAMTQDSSK